MSDEAFKDLNLNFTLKPKGGMNIPNLINKKFFVPSNLPSNIGISEIKKIKTLLLYINEVLIIPLEREVKSTIKNEETINYRVVPI